RMNCATRRGRSPWRTAHGCRSPFDSHSFGAPPMPVSIPETPRQNAPSATAASATIARDAHSAAPESEVLAQGSFGMRLLLFTFLALPVAILFESLQSLFRQ